MHISQPLQLVSLFCRNYIEHKFQLDGLTSVAFGGSGEVTFEIQITCIYFEGALLTRGKRSGQNSIGDNYHGITFANESNTVDGSGDLDGGHCVASKAGVVVTSDSACLTFLQCVFKCLFSSVF